MLDPAVTAFFDDRKEAWLNKKIKASMEDEEVVRIQLECDQVFSLDEWLPKAASRAGQVSMATHPCTFSHPSARKNKNGYVTSIISELDRSTDGFLKTGNVISQTDALGNAAALDVYKFLTLEMADQVLLIEHIKNDSDLAQDLLHVKSATYKKMREGFLSMVKSSDENVTSSKVKQVYFPIDDHYHQLSLLSNSGMIFALRERIDSLRFSDFTKKERELKKKNEFSEFGYTEIYNITTIGYGGAKPQNISVLNNAKGGKAHLLSSMPPTIEQRNIHFPKTNFFTESHRYYESREIFHALHKILKTDYNNINIREGRDYRLQELIDHIIDKMWAVRTVADSQYHAQSSKLDKYQQIWLCNGYEYEREEEEQWLDKLSKEITRWIVRSYEKSLGKQAIKLGKDELNKIADIVEQNREGLR